MQKIEILAPAGGPDALAAALEAGADAVYFGLKKLNARQGAANFLPSRLQATMDLIHSKGSKGYLTLNIDLCQRDLGEAARTLELARRCGVDAVLIKDPALLAMKTYFPDLSFHFSTQAGISASPGVSAAVSLGISRVVLARELSGPEIAACCRIPGMEIEVFVQGAMCFSCSGRCLLSSWIGGRSGNRGACASPCRFAWNSPGLPEHSRPFSMHDLCLLEHVSELEKMGVCSLKIEGRLKSPRWVSDAVRLYRSALDRTSPAPELMQQAGRLGNYTGRQLTDAYFREIRTGLTGESARPATAPGDCCSTAPGTQTEDAAGPQPAPRSNTVAVRLEQDSRGGLLITWLNGDQSSVLRIPPQRIANPRRALSLREIFDRLALRSEAYLLDRSLPEEFGQILLPKRHSSLIEEDLNNFIRNLEKEEDGNVRIPLAPELRSLVTPRPLGKRPGSLTPGDTIQYIRLGLEETRLLGRTAEECRVIFAWHPGDPGFEDRQLQWLEQNCGRLHAVSLPQVCYEEELPAWERLLDFCRNHSLMTEINSWEGLELSRRHSLAMTGGCGLAVLNSVAAACLRDLGCSGVTVSPEIDREQLEDLCACCEVPLLLTVFSRPLLFQSRVQDALPDLGAAEDQKKIRMLPRRAGSLIQYRPEQPCDWRSVRNPRIRVSGLAVDFCGSPDPAQDWKNPAPLKTAFLFNYDRQLR